MAAAAGRGGGLPGAAGRAAGRGPRGPAQPPLVPAARPGPGRDAGAGRRHEPPDAGRGGGEDRGVRGPRQPPGAAGVLGAPAGLHADGRHRVRPPGGHRQPQPGGHGGGAVDRQPPRRRAVDAGPGCAAGGAHPPVWSRHPHRGLEPLPAPAVVARVPAGGLVGAVRRHRAAAAGGVRGLVVPPGAQLLPRPGRRGRRRPRRGARDPALAAPGRTRVPAARARLDGGHLGRRFRRLAAADHRAADQRPREPVDRPRAPAPPDRGPDRRRARLRAARRPPQRVALRGGREGHERVGAPGAGPGGGVARLGGRRLAGQGLVLR